MKNFDIVVKMYSECKQKHCYYILHIFCVFFGGGGLMEKKQNFLTDYTQVIHRYLLTRLSALPFRFPSDCFSTTNGISSRTEADKC